MDAGGREADAIPWRQVARLWLDRRAVTAIEYALIAGIMVTALVLGVPTIAPGISNIFNSLTQHL